MNPYLLTVASLMLAAIAQTSIAWVAFERALSRGLSGRQKFSWLCIALGAAFLAIQHGYALELALRTGLFDQRQALLAAFVSLLFATGTHGLRPPKP